MTLTCKHMQLKNRDPLEGSIEICLVFAHIPVPYNMLCRRITVQIGRDSRSNGMENMTSVIRCL